MNKTKLKKLVARLREVRVLQVTGKIDVDFNMESWGMLAEENTFKNRKDMSCMTAACAIGHAGNLFKKEGFKLAISTDSVYEVAPVYKDKWAYEAVAEFFKITIEDARYLFAPTSYVRLTNGQIYAPTVSEVADRIENFLHGVR